MKPMTYAEIDAARYKEAARKYPGMMVDLIPAAMFTKEELKERGFELKDDADEIVES